MCDGVLKEDDESVEDDESIGNGHTATGIKTGQPKHILTKKKLIAIGSGGGSQESKSEGDRGDGLSP